MIRLSGGTPRGQDIYLLACTYPSRRVYQGASVAKLLPVIIEHILVMHRCIPADMGE